MRLLPVLPWLLGACLAASAQAATHKQPLKDHGVDYYGNKIRARQPSRGETFIGQFVGAGRIRASLQTTVERRAFRIPETLMRLAGKINPRGDVQRVFYPLGGVDATSAFALFEGPKGGARELTILDAMPFGTPRTIRQVHRDLRGKSTFFWEKGGQSYANIDGQPMHAMGAGLLWELERLGAKDIKVEYLDRDGAAATPARFDRKKFAADVIRRRSPKAPRPDIARMTFDLRGVRRTVLYVQGDVTAEPETLPPVLHAQLAKGVDGMVKKATLGIELHPRLTAKIGRHMDASTAVVVGAVPSGPGWSTKAYPDVPFGYGHLVVSRPDGAR